MLGYFQLQTSSNYTNGHGEGVLHGSTPPNLFKLHYCTSKHCSTRVRCGSTPPKLFELHYWTSKHMERVFYMCSVWLEEQGGKLSSSLLHPRWFFPPCSSRRLIAQLLPQLLITKMLMYVLPKLCCMGPKRNSFYLDWDGKVVGKVGLLVLQKRALPVKYSSRVRDASRLVSQKTCANPISEHLSEQLGSTRTIYFLLDLLLTFKQQLSHTLDNISGTTCSTMTNICTQCAHHHPYML